MKKKSDKKRLIQILTHKYDHVCPNVAEERCSICQARWVYEKKKLQNQANRQS